jgi:hypothetical protein
MIKTQTVLVLGAGASMPFGFPSGRGLWQHIVGRLSEPASDLVQVLVDLGHGKVLAEFRRELLHARPPSVDVFLDDRREYLTVGKAAIACGLIPYETASRGQMFDASNNHWYDYLYHRLTDCKRDEFQGNRLSIVTFNYDRSLEFYLFTTLTSRWGLKNTECAELLNAVPIIHVYGQLGNLPELTPANGLPYGADLNRGAVEHAMAHILLLPEADAKSPALKQAHELLRVARICFLGFGYHPTNLERLRVGELRDKIAMGSAYGIEGGERSPIIGAFSINLLLGDVDLDIHQYLRKTITLS